MFPSLVKFLKDLEKDCDVKFTCAVLSSFTSHWGFEQHFPTTPTESAKCVRSQFQVDPNHLDAPRHLVAQRIQQMTPLNEFSVQEIRLRQISHFC